MREFFTQIRDVLCVNIAENLNLCILMQARICFEGPLIDIQNLSIPKTSSIQQ